MYKLIAERKTSALYVGETLQLAVYFYKRDVKTRRFTFAPYTGKVIWRSNTPEIAVVSHTGLVTAISTKGWTSGIALAEITATLPAGSTPGKIGWSSWQSIPVLSENYARMMNDYVCVMPVAPELSAFSGVELYVGETVQLGTYICESGEGGMAYRPYTGEVRWVSENPRLLSVTDTGLVKALENAAEDNKPGKIVAIIPAARIKSGQSITVKQRPGSDQSR